MFGSNAEEALLNWRTCQLVGCWRRMIRFIEGNAKCRHLKKWPVKGLSERCLWWRHFDLAKATTLAGHSMTTIYVGQWSYCTVCIVPSRRRSPTFQLSQSIDFYSSYTLCVLFHLSRHHVLCRTHPTKIELNAGRYHASRQGQYIPKSDTLEFFHLRLVDNVQCWLFWEVNDVMLCSILYSNTHRTLLKIRKNTLSTKTCLHSVRYYWLVCDGIFWKTDEQNRTHKTSSKCVSLLIQNSEFRERKSPPSHPTFFLITVNTERVYVEHVEEGITNLLSKLSVNPNATEEKLRSPSLPCSSLQKRNL